MYTIGIYTSRRERFEEIMMIVSPQIEKYRDEFQFRHISKLHFSDELAGQILLVDIQAQKDFSYLKAASEQLTFPVLPILLYDLSPVVLTPEWMRFSACISLADDPVAQIIRILDGYVQENQLYIKQTRI